MAKDYKINEGNMIGAMPAEFDANTNLQQKVLEASADVKKGQVVVISGDMTVAPSSAASAAVIGVAMFDAKEGDPVSVETEGLFRLTASGAITAGAQVESAADGKVATKDNTVTKVIGIALNTASNGGEVFVKFSI
jgi:predicted RecA/RadA family phage recombinase